MLADYLVFPLLMMAGKDEVVEINVGGRVLVTLRSTLMARPKSKIAKVFSSSPVDLPKDSSGRLFLDRDPEAFGVLLNFLRLHSSGQVWQAALPKDPDRLAMVTQEAAHWDLPELREAALQLLNSASPSPFLSSFAISASVPEGLDRDSLG